MRSALIFTRLFDSKLHLATDIDRAFDAIVLTCARAAEGAICGVAPLPLLLRGEASGIEHWPASVRFFIFMFFFKKKHAIVLDCVF